MNFKISSASFPTFSNPNSSLALCLNLLEISFLLFFISFRFSAYRKQELFVKKSLRNHSYPNKRVLSNKRRSKINK